MDALAKKADCALCIVFQMKCKRRKCKRRTTIQLSHPSNGETGQRRVVTKKVPTRKATAEEEVPFSLGTCEEGFAQRVVSPKRREPMRKAIACTRRALSSLSPHDEVRSVAWLGCPEEGNHQQHLPNGVLLRGRRLGIEKTSRTRVVMVSVIHHHGRLLVSCIVVHDRVDDRVIASGL
jgi:hypothetical protein